MSEVPRRGRASGIYRPGYSFGRWRLGFEKYLMPGAEFGVALRGLKAIRGCAGMTRQANVFRDRGWRISRPDWAGRSRLIKVNQSKSRLKWECKWRGRGNGTRGQGVRKRGRGREAGQGGSSLVKVNRDRDGRRRMDGTRPGEMGQSKLIQVNPTELHGRDGGCRGGICPRNDLNRGEIRTASRATAFPFPPVILNLSIYLRKSAGLLICVHCQHPPAARKTPQL